MYQPPHLSSHPKIYRESASKAAHQELNFVEQVCPVLGNEAAPEVLGVFPQDLDPIELRTVGRQIVEIQPMFGLLAPLLFYRGALVYAGIVHQDDSRNLVRLSRNLVEERDYIITCRRSLLSSPGQRAIVAQGPEHVHALPMCKRFNGSGLADFSPTVLHWRVRAEPRFVEVQQFALLFVVETG